MHTSISALISIFIAFGALANGSTTEPEATISVIPRSVEYQTLVSSALAKFTGAGLSLPSLQIVFSDDDESCNGHLGTFQPTVNPMRITICSDLPFVLVHELAHAWVEANFDEGERQNYLQLRHKPSWNDRKHDWNERGVEDAAFVIQQILMVGQPRNISDEWSSRIAAYEFLTKAPHSV